MATFTPLNGGAGVSIACNTSTSTRAALPSPPAGVVANAIKVANIGVNYAALALGDGTVAATLAYQQIAPGAAAEIELPYAGGSGAPTYAAAISLDGATTLQITLGILS